jgi:hypothetical protein
MKRLLAAGLIALTLGLHAGRALAVPDEYDETQSHPLRIIAYVVHPIGYALEWILFRPFHYLVSQPATAEAFGHTAHAENRIY